MHACLKARRGTHHSREGSELCHPDALAIGQAELQGSQSLLPRQPGYLLVSCLRSSTPSLSTCLLACSKAASNMFPAASSCVIVYNVVKLDHSSAGDIATAPGHRVQSLSSMRTGGYLQVISEEEGKQRCSAQVDAEAARHIPQRQRPWRIAQRSYHLCGGYGRSNRGAHSEEAKEHQSQRPGWQLAAFRRM